MYKTIEKQKIPLDTRNLSKYIEDMAKSINNAEIIAFESHGMKLRGARGYKIIFLVKLS